MLESKSSQFTLSPDGHVLWQEKINNPLPGVPVAQLKKGAHALKPVIEVLDNEITAKHDKTQISNHLNIWFKTHMNEVLEPLMLLEIPIGGAVKDDPVSKIAAKVYDGLGIVSRESIEEIIADLTPELRVDLRAKKIRLGPILAFIPILKKPAAVRLRAVLWALYNDVALPVSVPPDGIVSVRIEDVSPNEAFYRAISYPLYGGRAVRIDMLDRVISCVYDHADKGKFQARHEMAEWLGCPIDDLYKVLEAMGHTKIYDPAEQVVEEPERDVQPQRVEKTEMLDETQAESAEKPAEQSKPELATFRLKKGKAFQKAVSGDSRGEKKHFDKKKFGNDKKTDKKPFSKKKDHKKPKRDDSPRVISAPAKKNAEDSPFAILQQLKK